MNNEEVKQIMINKIEKIVRDKSNENFDPSRINDRKNVVKEIIKSLEEVMDNENN